MELNEQQIEGLRKYKENQEYLVNQVKLENEQKERNKRLKMLEGRKTKVKENNAVVAKQSAK